MEPKVSLSSESQSLENTVASLRRIAHHLDKILPGIEEGPLKDDLAQMRRQCYAAIPYYCSMGPVPPKSGALKAVRDVAEATLGLSAVGLSVPQQRKVKH